MKAYYDTIQIQNRCFIKGSFLELPSPGICLMSGPNGSGKTLLVKNIHLHPDNRDSRIVLVDQDNDMIIKELSIIENIAMTNDTHILQMVQKRLREWNLDYLLSLSSHNLSGGEKRLINLLRGVFSQADFLIIDEPTNDLDYNSVSNILQILQELSNDLTILVVSHDDRLRKIADAEYQMTQNGLIVIRRSSEKIVQRTPSAPKEKRVFQVCPKYFFCHFALFVLCFIYLSCILLCYRHFSLSNSVEPSLLDGNEIIAYVPISSIIHLDGNYAAYPSVVLEVGNIGSAVEQLAVLKKLNRHNKESFTFSLGALGELNNSDMYSVFPLEYYMPDTKQFLYPLQNYAQVKGGYDNQQYYVETKPFFYIPDDSVVVGQNKSNIIQFDPVEYMEFLNLLHSSGTLANSFLSAAVIVMNEGFSTRDFYQTGAFSAFKNGNIYLCSQEASECAHIVSRLMAVLRFLPCLLFVFIITIAISFLETVIYMETMRKRFFLLKNYGFSFFETCEGLCRRACPRLPLLLLFLCFVIFLLICFPAEPYSLFVLLVSAYSLSAIYAIQKNIVIQFLKRSYRWDAR